MNLCVYASSSDALSPVYKEAAESLGRLMGTGGHTLIYGGGKIGLMGVLARSVHQHGGHVVGVIPEKLRTRELTYEEADELIMTKTMRERKSIMEERADAFVALPGGLGTAEEVMEILVLRQLAYHEKPLVFLNTNGIYDKLFEFFHALTEERFVKPEQRHLFFIAATPEDIFRYLEEYNPEPHVDKWFA
ncbi:MAG: TIGR00730 family Rossman fold protein [Candidatus Hydrogenedentes bacterium]|nr:TIGR00730 family Rossman fold protein [Candidatus Hydrogenedentota bacterium]